AVPFFAGPVQHENRRRPLRVVPFSQPLEFVGLVADVDPNRDELFVDEARDLLIRINLGIQPSTSASHWCRAEVEQHEPLTGAGIFQGILQICLPRNRFLCGCHRALPCRQARRSSFR
ncbi:MAG TPA: hypothetical protein VGJ39_11645, partial [Vicinamibacterales bacterium]